MRGNAFANAIAHRSAHRYTDSCADRYTDCSTYCSADGCSYCCADRSTDHSSLRCRHSLLLAQHGERRSRRGMHSYGRR